MFTKITSQSASLIDHLQAFFPDQKPQTLRMWIQKGFVTTRDLILSKSSEEIDAGIELTFQINQGLLRSPIYPHPIPIVYQCKDFIVLDKPSGLLSVNTSSKHTSCFSILKRYFQRSSVFVIHRLDQHASGLIVFALNKKAYENLKQQLKERTMKRSYIAITEKAKLKNREGTWTSYLKELPNFSVRSFNHEVEDSQVATSHYFVRQETRKASWVELELDTGRKHQLRVHCSIAGCPILGDKKYGPERPLAKRLCLHAKKLVFEHTMTKKSVAFYAPTPKLFFKFIPNLSESSS